jgi:hypothetical protein
MIGNTDQNNQDYTVLWRQYLFYDLFNNIEVFLQQNFVYFLIKKYYHTIIRIWNYMVCTRLPTIMVTNIAIDLKPSILWHSAELYFIMKYKPIAYYLNYDKTQFTKSFKIDHAKLLSLGNNEVVAKCSAYYLRRVI